LVETLALEPSFNHSLKGIGGVMFGECRDGLAPIGFENKEAIMHKIAHNGGFETTIQPIPHLQHLQATYGLAGYQTEAGIVLRLVRMEGYHPTGVQWSLPIKILNNRAFVKILNNGAFKWVRLADGIINP